jgi:phosphoribosylaminoimidazole carboxylase PurE protein
VNALVVILMGSPSDQEHVGRIAEALDTFDLPHAVRVASAHKTPRRLLAVLEEYEADARPKVYITVAGLSNALSGMVDAHTGAPVIACPPVDPAFGGADVFSSLRMPAGVAPLLILSPTNAALAAAKILALAEPALRGPVAARQKQAAARLDAADRELNP